MVGKPVVTRRGNPSGCPVLSLGVSTGAGQYRKQDSGICGHFVDTKTREPAWILGICENLVVADKPEITRPNARE